MLEGAIVVKVRRMTQEEMKAEGWDEDFIHGRPVAIDFDNGMTVYASSDSEGNAGGELFASQMSPEKTVDRFYILPEDELKHR